MWHWFKFMVLAGVLAGACLFGAAATPGNGGEAGRPARRPHGDVRPAPYWRWANGCRGGRYYRFLGGWGATTMPIRVTPAPRR